jgi:SAM-dependent methyltransferase
VQDLSYDEIGRGYSRHRRSDPRIVHALAAALGHAASVLNVGAGTGSYEPHDRWVVAVEPSLAMIRQRAAGTAPVIRAVADHLPFADGAFAATMAILTLHHWGDRRAGLLELRRVARERVVLLTWDPAHPGFWLTRDYFPAIHALDRELFPSLVELGALLGPLAVTPLAIPHDCVDGFLGAYWRRPAAYLDAQIRSAISSFARLADPGPGLAALRRDLDTGEWAQRNAELLEREEIDLGYRLVSAGGAWTGHATSRADA